MAKTEEKDRTEEQLDELMETVRPSVKVREQRIAGLPDSPYEKFDKVYKQQRLSFFGKLEFTRTVKRFIDDDERLASILAKMRAGTEDERTEAVVQLVLSMIESGPETAKAIFMQALNVPEAERFFVAEILDQPHDDETGRGGLTDDDAMEIIETFVEQNAKAIRDLFFDRLARLSTRVQEILFPPEEDSQTQGSQKRSKRTQQSTPRQ